MVSALRTLHSKKIIIITFLSGTGTAEAAAVQSLETMFRFCEFDDTKTHIEVYAACDSAPMARDILLQHSGRTEAKHVFGPIQDRLKEIVFITGGWPVALDQPSDWVTSSAAASAGLWGGGAFCNCSPQQFQSGRKSPMLRKLGCIMTHRVVRQGA